MAYEDAEKLKPCPICTSRRYWFDRLDWKCLGCYPRELHGQVWLELNESGENETNAVRFIVVDDDEMVRRGLKELLESQPGWKVIAQAGDGESAIRLVKDLRPDFLITDVAHPGPDGLENTRWVAQNLDPA